MTREQAILDECHRRGLSVFPYGLAWRIVGRHIDIIARRLSDVDLVDLDPRRGEKRLAPAR